MNETAYIPIIRGLPGGDLGETSHIGVDHETSDPVIEVGPDKRSPLDSIQQAPFAAHPTDKAPVIARSHRRKRGPMGGPHRGGGPVDFRPGGQSVHPIRHRFESGRPRPSTPGVRAGREEPNFRPPNHPRVG